MVEPSAHEWRREWWQGRRGDRDSRLRCARERADCGEMKRDRVTQRRSGGDWRKSERERPLEEQERERERESEGSCHGVSVGAWSTIDFPRFFSTREVPGHARSRPSAACEHRIARQPVLVVRLLVPVPPCPVCPVSPTSSSSSGGRGCESRVCLSAHVYPSRAHLRGPGT